MREPRTKHIEMMKAFSKLSAAERREVASRMLDQTLERVARQHGLSVPEAYAMLLRNRDKVRDAELGRNRKNRD